MHRQMEQRISLLSYHVLKQDQIVQMNEMEMDNYTRIESDIGSKVEQSTTDMVAARQELEAARGVRKNREEYDALASVILKTPSRQDTTKSMAEVEAELTALTAEATELEAQLQSRQKQFGLLIHTLRDIKRDMDSASTP